MSTLRAYEEHMREKGEAPLVPGPMRFLIMVLTGLALGFAEHWIRRQFPLPVLAFDWYLLIGIAAFWTVCAGLLSLSVHRDRRMRSQLVWLAVGLALLGAEWAIAEWDWRPATRLAREAQAYDFGVADARTMRTLDSFRAAQERIDARLAELRASVAHASGQSAASLRGWLGWRAALRPAERARDEGMFEITLLTSRNASTAEWLANARIATVAEELNAACATLMKHSENLPAEFRQALLDAGVWEWRTERAVTAMESRSMRYHWVRVYQLEARLADCIRSMVKAAAKTPPNPREVDSWAVAIPYVAAEHAKLMSELRAPAGPK